MSDQSNETSDIAELNQAPDFNGAAAVIIQVVGQLRPQYEVSFGTEWPAGGEGTFVNVYIKSPHAGDKVITMLRVTASQEGKKRPQHCGMISYTQTEIQRAIESGEQE
jgi:hypothetical protein